MNILYLSHLGGASFAGPTYSVPKQIDAQSKIDNVFWYNAVPKSPDFWKNISYYHDLTEYPKESIDALPAPFHKPDLIVVECFYNMFRSPLMRELMKGDTPYVIIPRGELTCQAQKRKMLKKSIANVLGCKQYARKAAAIQYLTEQEYIDSGDAWNPKYIVIPNGVTFPESVKTGFTEDGIKFVSIGRISPYHKGLDLLIDACAMLRERLIEENCKITICGPDQEGQAEELKRIVVEKRLHDIITFQDGVFGDEKKQLLLESDVFLIPSRFEGHPMALIEALSYGLPCVATTGSNMRREIDTYGAGWTADNEAQSICEALQAAIDAKENYMNISQNAVALSKKYEWNSIAIEAHTSFEKLLKGEINE